MKNTHHATISELVIGRDLLWLDTNACLQQSWRFEHIQSL